LNTERRTIRVEDESVRIVTYKRQPQDVFVKFSGAVRVFSGNERGDV
jgi:hypothetical protein